MPAGKLEAPLVRSRNPPAMPRKSLVEYIAEYSPGTAATLPLPQRSGYRTVRWSYREVAGSGGAIRPGIGIARN